MDTFFLLCAVFGGTIMLLQFALTVFGIGGHGGDLQGGDLGDGGLSHAGGDVSGHGDFTGHDPSMSQDGGAYDGHDSSSAHDSTHHDRHDTVWFFKIITFQTLVAAVAFFGIGGKAALEADAPPLMAVLVAAGVGFAAMNGVYYLVRSLNRFNADGTAQIERAVGEQAVVYLPVPATNSGAGKIHLTLQNRFTELQAVTSKDRLSTGTKVKITRVLSSDTVEVEPLISAEIPSHA
jgi:hypothetical protein